MLPVWTRTAPAKDGVPLRNNTDNRRVGNVYIYKKPSLKARVKSRTECRIVMSVIALMLLHLIGFYIYKESDTLTLLSALIILALFVFCLFLFYVIIRNHLIWKRLTKKDIPPPRTKYGKISDIDTKVQAWFYIPMIIIYDYIVMSAVIKKIYLSFLL
ncbi:hypothetical protein PT300_10745 [Enterobacteriaceae bacterium ESL0689]|nr:hypothetical protein [Enterobacteriaceae bacterium ESL0689]